MAAPSERAQAIRRTLAEHRASRQWSGAFYEWYCACNSVFETQFDVEMHWAETIDEHLGRS